MSATVVVVGLGEVGEPLFELVRLSGYDAVGFDVASVALPERGSVEVLHLCFPFEIEDFVSEAARYVGLLAPRLTIVNSTVAVGTTRAIHKRTGAPIAYSPVRGKHASMIEELRSYVKFVGGIDEGAAFAAAGHFDSLGMRTRLVPTPETAELAKLSETTYFGVLIAWAQELERYCDRFGIAYDDVVAFYDEISYLPPVRFFPGVIGGHCVMPNIEILGREGTAPLLDAVRRSNELKLIREEARDDAADPLAEVRTNPAR